MSEIEALLSTVARLRDPESGCPWDIEQTHQSITDCLIDECCELLQTIDRMDMEHMEEELGDVLLQVIDRMKSTKTAPVLAAMLPARAKELTMRIAERRKVSVSN